MVATHETFDFDQLSFAAQTKPNRAGGKYATVADFAADVELIFNTAKIFNTEGSDIFELADGLARDFDGRMEAVPLGPLREGGGGGGGSSRGGGGGASKPGAPRDREGITFELEQIKAQLNGLSEGDARRERLKKQRDELHSELERLDMALLFGGS